MIIKANFVLELVDDFTGKTLSPVGSRFLLDGRPFQPMRKPEGLIVFYGLCGTEFAVTVFATGYCSKKITVQTQAIPAQRPQLPVFLQRIGGRIYRDCEWLYGKGIPGCRYFALSREKAMYRLQSQEISAEGTSITLAGYQQQNLSRLWFAMGQGEDKEIFQLETRETNGSYHTAQQLQREHPPGEALIRAFQAFAGESGELWIPVEPGRAEQTTLAEYYDKGKKKWECLCAMAPR